MENKIYQHVDYVYDLEGDGSVTYDIRYAAHSDKNKLDLYIPTIVKEKYPLVVFIHGGGFLSSDKSHHLSNILNALSYGYAVASINYRLNDEAVYPAYLEDCKEALTYLAKHSEEYNLDKYNIILWGETHGGFLASTLGVKYHTTKDYRLAGVISFYAPIDLYDFHKHQIQNNRLMIHNDEVVDYKSFGKSGTDLLELLKTYEVLSHIDGSQPPFYLLHGGKDSEIPIKYSYQFAKELEEQRVPHTLDIVEEGTHGIDFYATAKYNTPIMQFIDATFKGKPGL